MPVIDFLSSLSPWVLALVLNGVLMGIALVGLWFVRRLVEPSLKLGYEDAYFAAVVAQSAMLLYGLIAALTAVGVWQRYSQVSTIVSGEAAAITSVWRDLAGYPEPLKNSAREILRGYTEQIIHDAWPQQRRGQVPSAGVDWMDRLQAQLFSFEPTTESQKILHAETVGAFNDLVKQRRQRLDSVRGGLPGVLWWVLLPGAVGCIVLCLFFHVNNARFQGVLLLGLAGFLSMVLFVIIALDRPFASETGITPAAYQLFLDQHR